MKIIKPIGFILMMLSLFFLAKQFYAHYHEVSAQIKLSTTTLMLIAIHAGFYGLLLNLLGYAWYCQLKERKFYYTLYPCLIIYGVSQIAKYLPGNVFQFAGRQLLANKYKISQHDVLQATLGELLLLAFTSLFICATFVFILNLNISNIDGFEVKKIAILGLLLLSTLLAFVYFVDIQLPHLFFLTMLKKNKILFLYLLFHIAAAFLCVSILANIYDLQINVGLAIRIMVAYLIAWLIGYVVPGAPGGLGIRELILLWLLKGIFPEPLVLSAAVMNRLVTTLGDFCFFGQAVWMKKRLNMLPANEIK